MTCVELQESLAESEGARSREQRDHLRTCPQCAALVADLSLIASAAIELREADEPSPRVWNSIEIALRKEGLIRPQRASRSLLPSLNSPWSWVRWLAPAAAALLIAVGIYMRPHSRTPEIAAKVNQHSNADVTIAGLNDDELLQEISDQTPALRAQYADNLRRVNQYIQDAKNIVDANPTDDDARRSLMDAYQEKAMLFELAMDRSLP
jgi:hypothetical protein